MEPILYNQNVNTQLYVNEGYKWKFYNRPLIPLIKVEEEADDNIKNNISNVSDSMVNVHNNKKIMVDKEVQTMYRESEVQTLPYSPAEYIPAGTNPEVLMIKHFKYGKELPPTINELIYIDKVREKTNFEGALPPTSDEASFMIRRKLMQYQEVLDWKSRESEIKELQKEKLNLLQCVLIEREKDIDLENNKKILKIKEKKNDQKNRLIATIQRKKIKLLRKILKRKDNIYSKNVKKDIIEEYYNFASKVYANITRNGLSIDQLYNKKYVEPEILQTYEGMSSISTDISDSNFDSRYNVNNIKKKIDGSYTKMQLIHKANLEKIERDIITKGRKKEAEAFDDLNDLNIDNIKPRPQTPELNYNIASLKNHAFEDFEKKEITAILLQRLLRGRSWQNMMYEGKEKRLALIEELLIISNIPKFPKEKEQELLLVNQVERGKNAVVEKVIGEAVTADLDSLNKELLRFKQEKKIKQFVEQAEEKRRIKEAVETGRRQAELTIKKRDEEFYNEIMKVHYGTVDTYLNSHIEKAVSTISHKKAMFMATERIKKMKSIGINSKDTNIIKGLVNDFLIPNIDRERLAEQVRVEEKRFHNVVSNGLNNIINKINK